MKRILLTLCVAIPLSLSAKQEYRIAANKSKFTISSDEKVIGRGARSSCCCANLVPPFTYTLSDPDGEILAKGSTSLFSPGALFTKSTYISVYGAEEEYLGCISGTIFTWARSKFHIYNADHQPVGTAYLNRDSFQFSIVDDADQDLVKIADMKGTIMSTMGHLDVVLYEDELKFDKELLDIFNLFILDNRASFVKFLY